MRAFPTSFLPVRYGWVQVCPPPHLPTSPPHVCRARLIFVACRRGEVVAGLLAMHAPTKPMNSSIIEFGLQSASVSVNMWRTRRTSGSEVQAKPFGALAVGLHDSIVQHQKVPRSLKYLSHLQSDGNTVTEPERHPSCRSESCSQDLALDTGTSTKLSVMMKVEKPSIIIQGLPVINNWGSRQVGME
ncbi:MAG: hypothetical protein Q9181_005117 [Wetmoreana brouardii]